MNNFTEKWTSFLYRFRWIIIFCFVGFVLIGGLVGGKLPNILSGGGWDVEGSQALKAKELVSEGFVGRGNASLTLIVKDSKNKVGSEEYSSKLEKLVNYIKQQDEIKTVYTWLDAPKEVRERMVGKDQYTSMGFVGLNIDEGKAINILPKVQKGIVNKAEELGISAHIVGVPAFWGDVAVFSQKGLLQAELFVLPLIFIVLLFIFRSLASTLTALLVTIISIASSMGVIYFTGLQFELSIFVENTVMMLGLGVGIDYSLILIHRFKLELIRQDNKKAAVAKTLKTAGHTVLFSGITIMAAMSALFFVQLSAIRSIAFGAVLVVFMAVLTSLTLLPVVLLLLGERINRFKIPFVSQPKEELNTKWYKWSHAVMKRPLAYLVLVVGILIVLAIPAKDLHTFTPDARILPGESPVMQGVNMVENSFGVGATNPISIVIHADNGTITTKENLAYISRLSGEISKLDNLTNVFSLSTVFPKQTPEEMTKILSQDLNQLPKINQLVINRYINKSKDTAVIDVDASVYAASDQSMAVVNKIKDELVAKTNPPKGVHVYVGGQTIEGHEANNVIEKSLIPVLIIMLIIVYLILFITFRSVFLPLKAIIMNLLSVSATYGVLVFVIAQGHGAEFLNIDSNGYIQNFVPILLLALLFGLSTDYEVFVLNRVKEEYMKSKNNVESIAVGLGSTGPLISGAALLMIAVFGGFSLSGILPIQTLGFGMAVAILIDATIVRFILVPVSMKLLGDLNWWFPIKRHSKQKFKQEKVM
ncbi:MMPL family transporter [Ectobacillus polymachus]|uniref:MMPL family transporter n=1 Tax=Ectobacillus polymachus TaxID=1508806 RepID=UPI003A89CF95